jgi:hypothetical protein
MVYFNGLFMIKPTDPSLSWSANKFTDLLNDRSPIIEGSAISIVLINFFWNHNTVIFY